MRRTPCGCFAPRNDKFPFPVIARNPEGVTRQSVLFAREPPAGSPAGGFETVKKACHCEEAQRADVAIRNPRPLAPLLKGGCWTGLLWVHTPPAGR